MAVVDVVVGGGRAADLSSSAVVVFSYVEFVGRQGGKVYVVLESSLEKTEPIYFWYPTKHLAITMQSQSYL